MKVTIKWKDGLPDDPLERARIEQILKTSDLTSAYSALKRLHDGDGAAAEEELERIEEERTQQAEQEMAIQERNALIGAAQPQENEKAPGKDSLYQMQQERGERGPANDR